MVIGTPTDRLWRLDIIGITLPVITQDTHKQRTATVAWNSEVAYARRQWNNWVYRMETETAFSKRTWMLTLTFNNRSLRLLRQAALMRYLGFDETFNLATYLPLDFADSVAKEARSFLSNYLRQLKRRISFRYIAVTEYGTKRGRIHFHLLIHCDTLTPRRVFDLWSYGFVKAKLVKDSKAAYYVAKYIIKSRGRLLCSSKYGLQALNILKSKPKHMLKLLTHPTHIYKLIKRISVASRYPTRSFIDRSISSLMHSKQQSPQQKNLPLKSV